MKKNSIFLGLLVLLISSVFVSSCKKDEDSSISPLDKHINEFIWGNMSYAYLWTANVPDLSEDKFQTQAQFDAYMNKTADHEQFFNDLLYQKGTTDKWSWIVDDYVALDNMFQGITKSMGFEFKLSYIQENDPRIVGTVIYVIKGGPADRAGIKRGYIFNKINNTELTDINYSSLLFDSESYSISFVNSNLTSNGITKNLIAEEVFENPILMDSVYTVGTKKVGYLVYNGFMTNYGAELNSVFGKFKNKGVEELILDLRYNGGGSIYTSVCLSSMIYGTDTTKIFAKSKYNSELEAFLVNKYGADDLNYYFANSIITDFDTENSEPINTLNLKKVYVITTSGTASASEMVINGLKPYMTVKVVGSNSHGKYVGSTTLYDINYKTNPKGDTIKTHKWALQPIILKISNSLGVSDYVNGFTPALALTAPTMSGRGKSSN